MLPLRQLNVTRAELTRAVGVMLRISNPDDVGTVGYLRRKIVLARVRLMYCTEECRCAIYEVD